MDPRLLLLTLVALFFGGVPVLVTAYLSLTTSQNEEFLLKEEDCDSGVLTFPNHKKLDCVCLKGIYSFLDYNKCAEDFTWITRGGNNHCFELDNSPEISRIELLSRDETEASLSILDGKYKYVKARYNSSMEAPLSRKGDTLMVLGTWTLVTRDQLLCVQSEPNQFCFFDKVPKFLAFRSGCRGEGKRALVASHCHPVVQSDGIETECPSPAQAQAHAIAKREIKGRTFLPGSVAMAPPPAAAAPIEREEDFGLQAAKGSDIIKSEVWNYVTEEARNILMDNNQTMERAYVTPAFDILQLSKHIMAKSCPTFYVPQSHWDMAVTSFISMQQRSFKFRETMIDLMEYRRIKDTLQQCLLNVTEIPFIPPNETCVDGEIAINLEEGMYYANGEVQTMVIQVDQMSTKNEPFIETVWKIFVHVHSLCFEFFKANRVNDHHRFTELLMPLFSNDVWDVWMKDADGKDYELKKDVYAGLLGDAMKLMSHVDYCAWYPRFEANYPWDLVRPKAKEQVNRRRRRSLLEEGHGTCTPIADFNCN